MGGKGHGGLRERRGDGGVAAHGAGGAHPEPPLGAARVEAVPAPGAAPQRVAARELAEADGARAAAAVVTGAGDVQVLGVQRVDGGDVEARHGSRGWRDCCCIGGGEERGGAGALGQDAEAPHMSGYFFLSLSLPPFSLLLLSSPMGRPGWAATTSSARGVRRRHPAQAELVASRSCSVREPVTLPGFPPPPRRPPPPPPVHLDPRPPLARQRRSRSHGRGSLAPGARVLRHKAAAPTSCAARRHRHPRGPLSHGPLRDRQQPSRRR